MIKSTLRFSIIFGLLLFTLSLAFPPLKGYVLEAVTWIKSNQMKSWYGTAFAINDQGDMVTAYHVVAHANHLMIMVNNVIYYVDVVATDPAHDVAIVHSDYKTSNYISVTNDRLSEIRVFGYPDANRYGFDLHESDGTAYYGGIGEEYINVHAFVCEGNSGSPILNRNNSLEGILTNGEGFGVCSTDGYGPSVKYTIDLATEYNIPIDYSIHAIKDLRGSIVILWGSV